MSGNPRNKFSGFKDGNTGPNLRPASGVAEADCRLVFRHAGEEPGRSEGASDGEAHAGARVLAESNVPDRSLSCRTAVPRDPQARPTGDAVSGGAAEPARYLHLQAGRTAQAVQLFTLNTLAYPTSANTHDSLGDAYLANGQTDLALRASEKAIELLAKDDGDDNRKKAIRDSAEQKIATIKGRQKK